MKKIIKTLIEYILVFSLFSAFAFFINKGLIIKGLYKDDLFSWSWFPGMSFYDYAIKFSEDITRYRPVFYIAQYLEFMIVGHNPYLFMPINVVLNSLVSFFIYYFSKRLSKNSLIAFLTSGLYIVAHFSYYQIGQVLGLLETMAQFLALLILYMSCRICGVIKKNDTEMPFSYIKVIILLILYFLVVFTHERFLCLLPIIIVAIVFSKTDKKKWPAYILFLLEIIVICIIRFFSIGKMLPAGTGGTNVEETFKLGDCINFCFTQVAMIFGINIGPEHLVGAEFVNIERRFIKYLGLASIVLVLVIFVIYLVKKINIKKETGQNLNFLADALFILFIAMCIGASSVTIRVEMRFVYVSFTACLLYLSYMSGYIKSLIERSDKEFVNRIISICTILLFVLFVFTRTPLELQYRTYFNKIHCILDQKRANSLCENTIEKYGLENVLNNKTVYLINKNYDFSEFYANYFFQIYDKEYKKHEIVLINDINDIPSTANGENSIVLAEDPATWETYIEQPIP